MSKPENVFYFSYQLNEFSFTEEKEGSFLFQVRLLYSGRIENRYSCGISDSCICDKSALISAVNILKAHRITSGISALPPDPVWDDLPYGYMDEFLEADYQVDNESFSLYGNSGIAATPRVSSDHPLYPDVFEAAHDLTVLFLSYKNHK